jgi:hypothetical protein
MFSGFTSKIAFSYSETNTELFEANNFEEANEKSFEGHSEILNGSFFILNFRNFILYFKIDVYFEIAYEVYLGINKPPPKLFLFRVF